MAALQELRFAIRCGAARFAIHAMTVILTGIGLLAGAAATLVLGRFMQGFLFGVRANDARIIFAAVMALASVSLLASYLPARRATLVDPMISLREE